MDTLFENDVTLSCMLEIWQPLCIKKILLVKTEDGWNEMLCWCF